MRRWANWGRTVTTRPTAWLAPGSEAGVIEAIRGARGRRLRVVGAGHSWSAIAAPEQIGMTLDRLTGVIARDDRTVTIRAGMRLRDLNAALAAVGCALPIVGSIAAQSLAGAIATGTHGSSLVHGNLSSLVERVRLVDGRGEVHDIGPEDPRLPAVRVHLGALGVVTEITLRIVPAFRLAETVEPIAIRTMPAQLEAIAKSAEYVKVWWMPHTRFAHVFRYERTHDAPSLKPDPIRQRWIDDNILHPWVFPAVLRFGLFPGVTPRICAIVSRTFVKPRQVGVSTLMLSTPMPFRHRETECAVPMPRAGAAVERTLHAFERDRLVANFPLEIRFVRGDDAWMSPAYGADTCQIGAYCWGPRSPAYFASFWRVMRALRCARPHWGKEMDHTAEEVRALWPRVKDFLALRDALDPDRVFASSFHTRTLGP
jgi:L-gulono-1,4-lactone dehydrogenase